MRKNKSTSFKTDDAYEYKLLKWAESKERGDYSKYIKRLIGRDMEGQNYSAPTFINPAEKTTSEDFNAFI